MRNVDDIDKIVRKLSGPQIGFLEAAWHEKIYRYSRGWAFDICEHKTYVFRQATVRSLWNRGLITGNFEGRRVLGSHTPIEGLYNSDGKRHTHSPDFPMLKFRPSLIGLAVLQYLEIVPDTASAAVH